jgi:hypothetical protein
MLCSRRYEQQAQSVLWCWLQACDLQRNLPSLTAMSHSAGHQLQWASHLLNPFPDTTQNSCLQITVSILKIILPFLQSKWTALHGLFFSNSVIMVPKLTYVNRHNLVPWTLCTPTEHWTHTFRVMARTLRTISKLSNSCTFPWLFVLLLNVNQASYQKNTDFVIYFGNESVPHFSSVLCAVFYTALLRQVFLLHHSLQHYLPLRTLCRSVAKSSISTNSTIHHSVHLLCTVWQAQSHKLLPFITPVLSHFVQYSLFNWIRVHFTSMVHVLTDDYHQNVCTNSTSTPINGKINVPFLTSTCDTKYASSPVVHKLQYDVTPSYNMTSHKHPF